MTPELWIPGPTAVRPELLARLAEPMFGHRTPRMRELLSALEGPLHDAFGAEQGSHRVAAHSCTATGLMEMGLRAVGPAGGAAPRVLACVHGSFSERHASVAESIGAEVVRVETPLGAPADLEAARRTLADDGPFDAVLVCLSETSTGALTEPAAVGDALRDRGDAALLVDAVTYLGAARVDASRNGLDFVFAGTQKALALPPGLGLYAVSEALLERARRRSGRGTFLDLVRITEAHAEGAPPMTPTLPHIVALADQLATIADGRLEMQLTDEPAEGLDGLDGWERRYRRHARMRAITRDWTRENGLGVFGGGERETSPTVTCVDLGGRPSLDVARVLGGLAAAGFVIGAGYGPTRARCLRIGHMGDHSVGSLRELLARLGEIVARD